MTNIACFKLR